jgi:energy-coupling factor transporter ATP-binding protein EcfA2
MPSGKPSEHARRRARRPTAGTARKSKVVVRARRLDTYAMKNVNWLWRYWLARGRLNVLAGPPGVAKTTIALYFAAIVSSGGEWPDGTRCPPGDVLIWTGEDNIDDTIKPRLIAMGADPARIYTSSMRRTRTAGSVPSILQPTSSGWRTYSTRWRTLPSRSSIR